MIETIEKRPAAKTRFVVQKGNEFVALKKEDIALLYTHNHLVHVVDKDEKKYVITKRLNQLEEELDQKVFFRVNRQFIVNLNFIKSFRSHQRVKIIVDLSLPNLKKPLIISQETASVFRKWITEA
jgi:DNA-binding LytR/AlgR family response regulator